MPVSFFCIPNYILPVFKYGVKCGKYNKNYSVLENGMQGGFSLKGDVASKIIY